MSPNKSIEGQSAGRELLSLIKKGDQDVTQVPAARTPLRSKLKSSASLFIPGQSQAPPPPPPAHPREGAKVPVRCIIEGTFGNQLAGIHQMEMQTHTEVEVVVKPSPSEMCDPWAIAQGRARSLHMLLQAFKVLGPQIKALEPSADESKLTVKYSEVSTDSLCWQFAQHGYCPRPNCRWEHVAMEVFIITIVMQPIAMDVSPMGMATPTAGECNFGDLPTELPSGGMVGYVAPAAMMPSNMNQVPGMVFYQAVPIAMAPMDPSAMPAPMAYIGEVPQACIIDGNGCQALPAPTVSTAAGSSERSGSMSPTSPGGTPKLRSNRVCWADIQDDEDA